MWEDDGEMREMDWGREVGSCRGGLAELLRGVLYTIYAIWKSHSYRIASSRLLFLDCMTLACGTVGESDLHVLSPSSIIGRRSCVARLPLIPGENGAEAAAPARVAEWRC